MAGLRAAADERARRAELERVRVEGEQATAQARSAERRKRRRLGLGAAAVLAVAVIGGLVAVLAMFGPSSLLAFGVARLWHRAGGAAWRETLRRRSGFCGYAHRLASLRLASPRLWKSINWRSTAVSKSCGTLSSPATQA